MIKLVYLGLGSNLKHPQYQIKTAIQALSYHPKIKLLKISSVYQSQAFGLLQPQPDYINQVVKIATVLTPLALLKYCQQLENQQGRVRKEHWGARTLDIDILLYHQQIIRQPLLTIPHPRLHLRAFVIQPLAEIYHTLKLPKLSENLIELRDQTKDQQIHVISERHN